MCSWARTIDLGLFEQHVGVAGGVRVGRAPSACALDVGADLAGVEVDVPIREPPVDGQRHVLPALEHGPGLEPRVQVGRRVHAGLVPVEDGAAVRAVQARGIAGGAGSPAGEPAGRGGEDQVEVILVVEPVEPREDELGRADGGAEVPQGPGHFSGRLVRLRTRLGHSRFLSSCAGGPMVRQPGAGVCPKPPRDGRPGARLRLRWGSWTARASSCGTTSRCGRRAGSPAGPARPA